MAENDIMDPAFLFRHGDAPQPISIPAGQPVFRVGDVGGVMYVLTEGSADVLIGGTIVEKANRGALFGEMGLIDQSEKRSATVIAGTNCTLVPVDLETFHVLVRRTPQFATYVMKTVVGRLRRMNAQLLEKQKKE
jgi:CRP/FNR family transcriptional regulator, cyclic AMP receptor protein